MIDIDAFITKALGKILDKVSNIRNPIFSFAIIVIIITVIVALINSPNTFILLIVILVIFVYSTSVYLIIEIKKPKIKKINWNKKYKLKIPKVW